jgi:anthranilate phosphoribosyltransferase
VGVSHPRLLDLVAGALRELGHEHALIVHGNPGMDELSPIGTTDVIEVRGGKLERYTLDPAEYFDAASFDPHDLRGGDPDYNARVINEVLRCELGGAARAAVVLNAGAALYVSGIATSIREGVAAADAALDSGKGAAALDRLRATTRAVLDQPALSAD